MIPATLTATSDLSLPATNASAGACTNCETPRMGEYCHGCGQHFLDGPFSVGRLIRDFVAHKLSLEGGLVRTFADLTFRPGAMIRDYLRGRRQRYTNPVAYLLVSAAAYTFFLRFWSDEYVAGIGSDWGLDAAGSQAVGQVMLAVEQQTTLTTLLLCFFFVPLLRVFFWNRTSTAGACVFAFYVFGHVLMWQAILTPVAVAASPDVYRTLSDWSLGLLVLMTLGSAGGFFGTRLSTFVRIGAAMTLSLLCAVVTLLIVAGIWIVFTAVAQAGPVAQ